MQNCNNCKIWAENMNKVNGLDSNNMKLQKIIAIQKIDVWINEQIKISLMLPSKNWLFGFGRSYYFQSSALFPDQ